jgi:hypothetical protein
MSEGSSTKRKAPEEHDKEEDELSLSPGGSSSSRNVKRERTTTTQEDNHNKETEEIYDLAQTFGYQDGDRLEVAWEIEMTTDDSTGGDAADADAANKVEKHTHWWGATLLPWEKDDIVDGNVAVRKLKYDPYPEGGFPEESIEQVVFLEKTLMTVDTQDELDFRRQGETQAGNATTAAAAAAATIAADPSTLMEHIIQNALNKRKEQFAKLTPSQQAMIASQLADVTDKVVENLEQVKARSGVVTTRTITDMVESLRSRK